MIIANGCVAFSGETEPVLRDIRIRDGTIVAIGESLAKSASTDGETVDARGLRVLPGGIDPHVHFYDPGYTHKEDFEHGTGFAASGGVTTIVDMPCTSDPPVSDVDNFRTKLEAVRDRAVVDFAFHGGVSRQMMECGADEAMESLAGRVTGLKCYSVSGMEEVWGALDAFQLRLVVQKATLRGLPVLLHAEDASYVNSATAAAAEVLAGIDRVGTPRITGETCPHYLEFSLDDFLRRGASLKVAPPVKQEGNRQRLWELLADGTIDYVASDHAPGTVEEKSTADIWRAASGVPGVGTILPYMLSRGLLEERFGLWDRKGSIAPGKDTDLVLFRPGGRWTVRGRSFCSRGTITPFEGMVLQGRVEKTFVRGLLVFDRSGRDDSDTTVDVPVPGAAGRGALLQPASRSAHPDE